MTLGFSQQINGKPNYFIEKIWSGIIQNQLIERPEFESRQYRHQFAHRFKTIWDIPTLAPKPKITTIRHDPHNRWKAGMNIHPVINNRSTNRFQFAPAIPCLSVQKIEVEYVDTGIGIMRVIRVDGLTLGQRDREILAINDGFNSIEDFFAYFNKDFNGKIIHWTDLQY